MIYGVGIDSVEISRIKKSMENPAFVAKVFCEEERRYITASPARAFQRAAGIFCAKEAVSKALGCGLFALRPGRILITHGASGRPEVLLSADVKLPPLRFFLSITHTKETAQAVAVAELCEKEEAF